jgi:hypothetical protein
LYLKNITVPNNLIVKNYETTSLKNITNDFIKVASKIKCNKIIQDLIPEYLKDYIGIHLKLTDNSENEIFSLSKCKMILQCAKYSTFSFVAALISQITNNLIYSWKPCLNITINNEIFDHVINESELSISTDRYNRINF